MKYAVFGILMVTLVCIGFFLKEQRDTEKELRLLRTTLAQLEQNQKHLAQRFTVGTPVMSPSFQRRLVSMNSSIPEAESVESAQDNRAATEEALDDDEMEQDAVAEANSRISDFAPVYTSIEKSFFEEPVDTSWASNADSLARDGLLKHMPEGSNLDTLDCRTSMCRIETEHDNQQRADELIERFLGSPETRPWNGGFATGTISEDEATGRVVLVTYLSREGYGLPLPKKQRSASL